MNQIVKTSDSALPDYLKGASKSAKIGNVDANDLIIPRIKLIQATSPEVTDFNNAKIGEFWHTTLSEPFGKTVRFIPIMMRKSLVLWAPRDDDRGVLARSTDCINWDEGYDNLEFTVKLKNVNDPVVYHTKRNVAESGLAEFGSGVPGDPKSRPAASLTYVFLIYLPDFPHASPVTVINTRSSVKPGKMLLSKIDIRPVDHYYGVYSMTTVKEDGAEGPYFNYSYQADGYADEATAKITKGLFERFKEAKWAANDESDEVVAEPSGGGSSAPSQVSKKNEGKF